MSRPVRWYNLLAAWIYERISDPLLDLAIPVWEAQAEEGLWEMEDPRWSDEPSMREPIP